MKKLIMIKYGELTTKKANRKVFIQMLENNIKLSIVKINYFCYNLIIIDLWRCSSAG